MGKHILSLVLLGLITVGPSRANIDPSLLAEIFGPAPPPVTESNPPVSDDDGQRLDVS